MSQRTVLDATSHEVIVPDSPKRIISLIPSVTEILFTLGLGPSVIGVTIF